MERFKSKGSFCKKMKHRKIYIEFAGISGSGKTTLAKKLYDQLSSHFMVILLPYKDDLSRNSFLLKGLILFRFYFRRPKSFFHILTLFFSKSYGFKGSLYTLFRRKQRVEKYFCSKKSNIVLNKEGSLQLYRTHGDRITKTQRIPHYHTLLSCRNYGYYPILVNINVDIKVALERCNAPRTSKQSPDQWSLYKHSKEEQESLLSKWNKNKNAIVQRLEADGIRVIKINSSQPSQICVADIIKHIEFPNQ